MRTSCVIVLYNTSRWVGLQEMPEAGRIQNSKVRIQKGFKNDSHSMGLYLRIIGVLGGGGGAKSAANSRAGRGDPAAVGRGRAGDRPAADVRVVMIQQSGGQRLVETAADIECPQGLQGQSVVFALQNEGA